eukprot:snap_masked-scaffold_54-processed-gene-0.18-mRNA-1 protein AED:1.00 eAED:1.00 QI:0/0/0/0/1/1/3/0/1476
MDKYEISFPRHQCSSLDLKILLLQEIKHLRFRIKKTKTAEHQIRKELEIQVEQKRKQSSSVSLNEKKRQENVLQALRERWLVLSKKSKDMEDKKIFLTKHFLDLEPSSRVAKLKEEINTSSNQWKVLMSRNLDIVKTNLQERENISWISQKLKEEEVLKDPNNENVSVKSFPRRKTPMAEQEVTTPSNLKVCHSSSSLPVLKRPSDLLNWRSILKEYVHYKQNELKSIQMEDYEKFALDLSYTFQGRSWSSSCQIESTKKNESREQCSWYKDFQVQGKEQKKALTEEKMRAKSKKDAIEQQLLIKLFETELNKGFLMRIDIMEALILFAISNYSKGKSIDMHILRAQEKVDELKKKIISVQILQCFYRVFRSLKLKLCLYDQKREQNELKSERRNISFKLSNELVSKSFSSNILELSKIFKYAIIKFGKGKVFVCVSKNILEKDKYFYQFYNKRFRKMYSIEILNKEGENIFRMKRELFVSETKKSNYFAKLKKHYEKYSTNSKNWITFVTKINELLRNYEICLKANQKKLKQKKKENVIELKETKRNLLFVTLSLVCLKKLCKLNESINLIEIENSIKNQFSSTLEVIQIRKGTSKEYIRYLTRKRYNEVNSPKFLEKRSVFKRKLFLLVEEKKEINCKLNKLEINRKSILKKKKVIHQEIKNRIREKYLFLERRNFFLRKVGIEKINKVFSKKKSKKISRYKQTKTKFFENSSDISFLRRSIVFSIWRKNLFVLLFEKKEINFPCCAFHTELKIHLKLRFNFYYSVLHIEIESNKESCYSDVNVQHLIALFNVRMVERFQKKVLSIMHSNDFLQTRVNKTFIFITLADLLSSFKNTETSRIKKNYIKIQFKRFIITEDCIKIILDQFIFNSLGKKVFQEERRLPTIKYPMNNKQFSPHSTEKRKVKPMFCYFRLRQSSFSDYTFLFHFPFIVSSLFCFISIYVNRHLNFLISANFFTEIKYKLQISLDHATSLVNLVNQYQDQKFEAICSSHCWRKQFFWYTVLFCLDVRNGTLQTFPPTSIPISNRFVFVKQIETSFGNIEILFGICNQILIRYIMKSERKESCFIKCVKQRKRKLILRKRYNYYNFRCPKQCIFKIESQLSFLFMENSKKLRMCEERNRLFQQKSSKQNLCGFFITFSMMKKTFCIPSSNFSVTLMRKFFSCLTNRIEDNTLIMRSVEERLILCSLIMKGSGISLSSIFQQKYMFFIKIEIRSIALNKIVKTNEKKTKYLLQVSEKKFLEECLRLSRLLHMKNSLHIHPEMLRKFKERKMKRLLLTSFIRYHRLWRKKKLCIIRLNRNKKDIKRYRLLNRQEMRKEDQYSNILRTYLTLETSLLNDLTDALTETLDLLGVKECQPNQCDVEKCWYQLSKHCASTPGLKEFGAFLSLSTHDQASMCQAIQNLTTEFKHGMLIWLLSFSCQHCVLMKLKKRRKTVLATPVHDFPSRMRLEVDIAQRKISRRLTKKLQPIMRQLV